jgi:hypothetical protein
MHYPASESGGSMSETVRIDIPVNIEIDVDTRAFDNSVAVCQHSADLLTGSVVATESANILSIRQCAKNVSKTVVGGFFSLISSELSQQITQHKVRCEALVLKLRDLTSACLGKRTQMEKDYHRISSRYSAIFEDLDNELSHRIRAVDQRAFALDSVLAEQTARPFDTTILTTAAVAGPEDNKGRVAILISGVRQRALTLLASARTFLLGDRQLFRSLQSILSSDGPAESKLRSLPVLYMQSDSPQGSASENLITAQSLDSPSTRDQILQCFRAPSSHWVPMDERTHSAIGVFLAKQVSERIPGSDPNQTRVAANVMRLWQAQRPSVLRESMSAQS